MATGNVTFRQDWCKGCGLCVAVCPKKIIFLDESITNRKGYHPATVKDMDQCIGCANCARMCPDSIITVERV
ncbi:MAG: 4Fe-4S binding protein [Clostridiaceae bacterium]|jgi:2-oxoglutarate ferredoxin oxidoreductase subunit delta|nr:4Fe-4S binding protein [Clostridia bacterium]MBP6161814.1 4Fe-4S binding protein [Clostridia bacterium]MBP6949885.1 4Fe-4S binding protein [Clostridia bacterium]NMA36467.1 4Fe-4S binding protein [Clostridiaceae bacterium]HHU98020.1 4Fe-4S binding protein [Petrimonas sp.]